MGKKEADSLRAVVAAQVLEGRLANIAKEKREEMASATSDGKSTLRLDMREPHGNRSESRRKTKAERAAETARINALAEAIALLRNESDVEVTLRFQQALDARGDK